MIRIALNNYVRKVRKDEGGFTLIELLIVIVVLGVLAGIVVFGVGTFRQDATAAACKADAKSVSVAAEAFRAKSDTDAYPASIAVLVSGGYLKAAPTSTGLTYSATTGNATCPAPATP
jgi:prepilin-type N-terminal cleavage/methylation domain-containing protein